MLVGCQRFGDPCSKCLCGGGPMVVQRRGRFDRVPLDAREIVVQRGCRAKRANDRRLACQQLSIRERIDCR